MDLQLRLLQGLQGLLLRTEQGTFLGAKDQVLSLLYYFAKHFSKEKNEKVLSVKITHQEIADWLGLSRENVSIQMKQLGREGSIQIKDHFIHLLTKNAPVDVV